METLFPLFRSCGLSQFRLLRRWSRRVDAGAGAPHDPGERGGSVLVLQQQSGEGREESGISRAGADDALIGSATILVGAAPILGLPHPGKRGIMLPAGTLIRGASVLNYGSSQDSEQSPSDLQSEELTTRPRRRSIKPGTRRRVPSRSSPAAS